MITYIATSYAMGRPVATATFEAGNTSAALIIATQKLGHSRAGRSPNGQQVAVIGVKAQ